MEEGIKKILAKEEAARRLKEEAEIKAKEIIKQAEESAKIMLSENEQSLAARRLKEKAEWEAEKNHRRQEFLRSLEERKEEARARFHQDQKQLGLEIVKKIMPV